MFWNQKNKYKEENYKDILKNETRITDYLTYGLLAFDKKGKLFLINPQAEELFKVKKEKILGKAILELNRFPNFSSLISLLGGGIAEFFEKELRIRENFILEVTSVPILTKGEKVGTLVILSDVTREKLVDRMKSEFVTLAAHQLRTPTSGIKWSLRALLDGDLGKLNKEQKETLEKTYNTNDKVIRLVNDLLNVAQIEEGKYLSKLTLSNIEEVIQSVVGIYTKKMKEKKLKFEFKKPEGELPKVMLDQEKMKIAVENILDNAVNYTLPGGKISVFIKSDEKEIEIQVKDTGIGIPQRQQEKVFTKFFRSDSAMKVETEGSGLGLCIAKNIIEAHGGRIWFNSEEGRGSTFYFIIPIKEEFGEFLTEEFY